MQEAEPSQRIEKHLLDRSTSFVYGRIRGDRRLFTYRPLAVTAYSNRYKNNELVDSTHVAHEGTHYGLNLPDGQYELLVLSDQNRDGTVDQSEVIGRRHIEVGDDAYPDNVVGNIDIQLSEVTPVEWSISIPVPEIARAKESLFFPRGAIRELKDPLFDESIASLGMYEPAAFLEQAPTMFYALEEDSYKIPVVFVHGIGGSPRNFASIVERLDRERYKPWFFYYPSGSDLDQLAQAFYNILLSGEVVPTTSMPVIIVAHSMGGLIVREALNRYRGSQSENRVELLVTIASPLGGHPAATMGQERAPLVLPCWRDLNPQGEFIKRLFRKPLPSHVNHQLVFAYGNPEKVKLGENSDGVAPLSSQLRGIAQRECTRQVGFDASHMGVLSDAGAVRYIVQEIGQVTSAYPEPHIEALAAGGLNVELDDSYSARQKFYITGTGKYLLMLATGELGTLGNPELEHFVDVARGRADPTTDIEMAWLKLVEDYPQYGNVHVKVANDQEDSRSRR